MPDNLMSAIVGVMERVRELSVEDQALRARLRALATAYLAEPFAAEQVLSERSASAAAAGIGAAAGSDGDGAEPQSPEAALAAERETAEKAAVRAQLVAQLTLASEGPPLWRAGAPASAGAAEFHPPPPRAAAASATAAGGETSDAELGLIETRCRLKADGARWAVTRRHRLEEGADFQTEIEPLDREIIEKARSVPDCFLWMCHPAGPNPPDPAMYDDVAGCFDAVASAVSLTRALLGNLDGNWDDFERTLDLSAEAQSALRQAVEIIGGSPDKDQLRVYNWLRGAAARHQYYIRRHMRADDPADPTAWAGLETRVQQIDSRLQDDRQRSKRRQTALNRVRFHLKQIRGGGEADRSHHWKKVIDSVEELVHEGVQPSSAELRDLLLPVIDDLPESMELPQKFQLVLREVDRFMATRPAMTAPETATEPTEDVRKAAELLAGRSAVMIGGERRPHAHHALKTALGLKELDWLETREHESIMSFESHVARPDVAVVILAIRWSSHSFGDVKLFCDAHNKPLVRLPAGYSPNQVAVQILSQVSGRLAGGG